MSKNISYFAKTNFRSQVKFGLKQKDRLSHLYIIGKTGSGKSTLIESFFLQDIVAGRGCCLLDPHGDLVDRLHSRISKHNKSKLTFLDLTDLNQSWKYNPLRRVSKEKQPLVTAGILNVFEHLFKTSWGDRLEHILRFTILALLEQPQASFKDLLPMIQDQPFRKKALENVETKEVLKFWNTEFEKYREYNLIPIYNKIGSFLAYPVVRKVLYENPDELRLRSIMDKGEVLLVNLSKGIIGEDTSQLLGSLLMTSLGQAAFSRADIPEESRLPFFIYADEFQNFTGSNLAHMLSELRKYKVGLILANQFLEQIKPEIREAVLGNTGTLISFRVGGKDAPYIAREMQPVFTVEDLMKLPNYYIYLKLMIDGKPSEPFSATTFLPIEIPSLKGYYSLST